MYVVLFRGDDGPDFVGLTGRASRAHAIADKHVYRVGRHGSLYILKTKPGAEHATESVTYAYEPVAQIVVRTVADADFLPFAAEKDMRFRTVKTVRRKDDDDEPQGKLRPRRPT